MDIQDMRLKVELGTNNFITKPFNALDLFNVVEKRLKNGIINENGIPEKNHPDQFLKSNHCKPYSLTVISKKRKIKNIKKKA